MPQPLFIRFLQPRGWTVVPVFTRRVRRRGSYFATRFPNFYSAVAPVSKYHRICSDTLTVPVANPISPPTSEVRTPRFAASLERSRPRLASRVLSPHCSQELARLPSGTERRRGLLRQFRRRAARIGDEVRRLAVSQQRLRIPLSARASVPASPWPGRGAFGIRDSRLGKISRAGKVRLG